MPSRSAPVRPVWWPSFSSSLRSTALTARLGRVLGLASGICFLTGLLSALQYQPLTWLPWPASPPWLYRITQGLHVATGTACLPLIMVKLWSVYPNLFRFPPVRSLVHALERGSVAVLVAASLVQLVTGFFNALNWYPFRWDFVVVHHYLAYVVNGALLLHVGIKLPDIAYGLRARLADADVLTEIPWDENPVSHSNAGEVPPPPTPGLGRRGVLTASGIGIGLVVATSVGQTVTPLEPIGLLAIRHWRQGPQQVPVNRAGEQAGIRQAATSPDWTLQVTGPQPYVLTLADLAAAELTEDRLPLNCVEGWSVGATWRGLRLLDLVERAGGGPVSSVRVVSLERGGIFTSRIEAGRLGHQLRAARTGPVYGPGLPRNTPYAGVAALFASRLAAGEAARVFEDGRQRRDFVHVTDVARAVAAAVHAPLPSGLTALNIGSGRVTTIGEVAAALTDAVSGPPPVITGEFRLGDVRHVTADSSAAARVLGWRAQIELRDGVRDLL